MENNELASMYERDLRKLIAEINLFSNEDDLWKTAGTVKNACGNLALHIIGGLNFLVGTTLAKTGYVRNRDKEFTEKNVDRRQIVEQLEALIPLIHKTLNNFTNEELQVPFPIYFDKDGATIGYVLTQLLLHLNYHLGQVNYLRRILA